MSSYFPFSVKRSLLFLIVLACAVPAHADTPQVKVAPLQPATLSRKFEIPAHTEPAEEAHIFSRATGIIRERKVDIGDRVKAGEVLATIEAPEIDRQTEAAKSTIDQAKARAQVARTIANRAAGLLRERAVSRESTEQSTATADELDAAVRVAEAEYARLNELQRFATIKAPFDATIAARAIDQGDHVNGDPSSSDAWLFHLVRINELRIVVEASPDLALRVQPGRDASVRFPDLPGKSFPAKVSRISHLIDRKSGTMRVEMMLKNEDRALPAGLTGTATFDLEPAPETFLIPTNALIVRGGKTVVATVEDGKVKFVEVLPGRNLGDTVEATSSGLSSSPVIVSPNAMLRESDAVDAVPLPPKPKP